MQLTTNICDFCNGMHLAILLQMYILILNIEHANPLLKNIDPSRINRLRIPHVYGIVSTKVYALNPLDLVGYLLNVKSVADCISYCSAYVDRSKNTLCWSINFIRSIGACLLSSSTKRDRLLKIAFRSLFIPEYMEIYTDEGPLKKFSDFMYHGERPPLCGLNYFGYDRSFNIRRSYRSKRIIDGFSPRPYDAPWTGIMLENERPRCTVTLISKKPTGKQSRWAFTAKHCVHVDDDYDHDDQFSVGSSALNKYTFIFGVHDTGVSTQQVVVRKADQAHLHPEEGLNPKDVALLYFHKPIKFTNYINGLCLPDNEEQVDLSELNCFTCGWGATLTSIIPPTASNMLQCIKTEIEPPTPMHRINGDTNSILKTKYPGPGFSGPFHGDSGGPIFCQRPSTGAQMFLFGLVHGGTSSSSNRYSTGARMTYFSAWAKTLINRRVSCEKDPPSLEICCRFSKC